MASIPIYCQNHTQKQISFICISQHECQRMLCSDCLYTHKIPFDKTLTIQKFKERLKAKIVELQISDQSELKAQRLRFQIMINELEQKFKVFIQNIRQTTLKMYQEIESQEQFFYKFLTDNIALSNTSWQDINILVDILEGIKLNTHLKIKEQKLLTLQKLNSNLSNQISQLDKNIQHFIATCQKIDQMIENKVQKIQKDIKNKIHFKWKDGIFRETGWYRYKNRLYKTKFKIEVTAQGKIQYIKDGAIMRMDNKQDIQMNNNDICRNIEQIKKLSWRGSYNKANKKIGKWTIIWKNEVTDFGGVYDDKGNKTDIWKEQYENYSDLFKALYIGEYIDGKKIGNWITKLDNLIIGGGNYILPNVKDGKWVELNTNLKRLSEFQVYIIGEYKNGKKQGIELIVHQNKIIAQGIYDQDGKKNGKWVEVFENYNKDCQVFWVGIYREGLKYGKWNLVSQKQEKSQEVIIGGGTYDELGLKIGQWIELHNNYQNNCQVTYNGQYKQGKKIGKWITSYKPKNKQDIRTICNGNYDENGNKTGNWIVLHKNFFDGCLINYEGVYKFGKKQGYWKTQYCQDTKKNPEIIGGGAYNENGQKNEEWIDLDENFWDDSQIIYKGYYCNGQKQKKWDTMLRINIESQFQNIGGGQFNENGMKDGKWIELCDNFFCWNQCVLIGEYQNGLKKGDFVEKKLN
ncbi:unnamed protein product [Paramecium octaurelia]|uniref:Uncharacterized protein n=1 Tax=Paramecium octaurelia TaxID=43137 RepID=A0A8S1WVH6_PAROT|nr:unnamed protein product [Paramecium octaurelia]